MLSLLEPRVVATRSAVSLSSLGLRSSVPGPTTDFAPPEAAAKKMKVDEAPLWSMTPAPAAPAWQQWDGHDLPKTSSYEFRGFHRALLNCSYFVDQVAFKGMVRLARRRR